jgi:hypothetical protein
LGPSKSMMQRIRHCCNWPVEMTVVIYGCVYIIVNKLIPYGKFRAKTRTKKAHKGKYPLLQETWESRDTTKIRESLSRRAAIRDGFPFVLAWIAATFLENSLHTPSPGNGRNLPYAVSGQRPSQIRLCAYTTDHRAFVDKIFITSFIYISCLNLRHKF